MNKDLSIKIKEKAGKSGCHELSFSKRLGKRITTFLLVDIAWIFFAADNLHHVYYIFQQMFSTFQTTSIYGIGLDRGNWFVLCAGIIVLMIVDAIHEKGREIFSLVNQQAIWFRWTLYLGLIWCIIMFGIYGVDYDAGQFIYFQF